MDFEPPTHSPRRPTLRLVHGGASAPRWLENRSAEDAYRDARARLEARRGRRAPRPSASRGPLEALVLATRNFLWVLIGLSVATGVMFLGAGCSSTPKAATTPEQPICGMFDRNGPEGGAFAVVDLTRPGPRPGLHEARSYEVDPTVASDPVARATQSAVLRQLRTGKCYCVSGEVSPDPAMPGHPRFRRIRLGALVSELGPERCEKLAQLGDPGHHCDAPGHAH